MDKTSTLNWIIATSALIAFGISFFILYWNTEEFLSSVIAAGFSGALIGGAAVVLSWLVKAKP